MHFLVDKAFKQIKALPEERQEEIAREIIALLNEEKEWDALVNSPKSLKWLEQASKEALEEHARGETKPFPPR